MIRRIALFCVICLIAAYSDARAVGLEMAVGGWGQSIGGTLSYSDSSIPDVIDLDNDIRFDDETKAVGRVKIDMPLVIPNIYLMAAPMEFEGTGSKSTDLTFGDITFDLDAALNSKITLNQYDVGFYYGLPFVKTATLDKLNVDVGLNIRIADFEAEVTGRDVVSGTTVTETKSLTLPIPMLYVGVQFMPIEALAIEAEGRGIAIGDNRLYSLIGRVRYNFAGPVFLAGGYRYDKLEIDEDNVDAEIDFQGPFVELGLKF